MRTLVRSLPASTRSKPMQPVRGISVVAMLPEHYASLLLIADEAGVALNDVIDDWEHRAAIREEGDGMARERAERIAVTDVRRLHIRQECLL